MREIKFIGLAVMLGAISTFAAAQQAPASSSPTVQHVPIRSTPADSGKQMFNNYCAVCHGKDAKGNGPAAPAMKTLPPDLTLLAQKNGGKYPSLHVEAALRGQAITASHGSPEMPVWGPLFSSLSHGDQGEVQQRISNLVKYIDTLQAK